MVTKAKAKPTAERAALVDKEPTQLHTDFAAYIKEQTGYEPDEKTVQLATILRMDFQRSDTNQERLAAAKQAREDAEAERERKREAREAKRAEKESAKAEKAEAKPAAKKAAPAKKAATPAAKKSAAKPAAPRRRAAAKKPAEDF